jgi:bis(5'-nucleosyl)-tetraphosphatase (symmetrical)
LQPVFVGDVQGCVAELDEVLERAARAWGERFELWLVGDAINRGPGSLQVLRRVRELSERGRARFVLGNHEIAFLHTALGLRRPSPGDTFTDVLDSPELDDWVDWLLARPLVQTGVLGEQPFAMVHAAVHPRWTLEELAERAGAVQRRLSSGREAARSFLASDRERRKRNALDRLTSCRSVSGDAWSSSPPQQGFVAWHAAWSRQSHSYGVVYGHWSLQGLHVAAGLRGLDTGCVHHGRDGDRWLTAWIPDPRSARPFDVPDRNFWQVPARRAYYGTAHASS